MSSTNDELRAMIRAIEDELAKRERRNNEIRASVSYRHGSALRRFEKAHGTCRGMNKVLLSLGYVLDWDRLEADE